MKVEETLQKMAREIGRMKAEMAKSKKVDIAWIPLPNAMIALGKRSLKPRYFGRGKRAGELKYKVGDVVPMSYVTIMRMLRNDPAFELKKVEGNWFITKYPPDFVKIHESLDHQDDAA